MMQSLMQRILFFSKFMSSPRTIGSITPSSKYLVNSLLKPVNWDQTKTVLELGAGTGVVTREIANRVNHSCRVITFELDPELRRYLKNQFPRFVHCCDARNLKTGITPAGNE
ncbi:class I SAM-dependent methyltransferase [Thermoactinomyces sp. Gus2-1]|uniref:class I SAM-dependent methyltransferase n=1 Tax=Thermoactinomyces sp. Gus2-1 TaxID=1535750 RepID=UPI00069024F8|nr:rRNA adenine N-6-methyltransferase family protein [Thermoactinomyces sp. Gus2-1]